MTSVSSAAASFVPSKEGSLFSTAVSSHPSDRDFLDDESLDSYDTSDEDVIDLLSDDDTDETIIDDSDDDDTFAILDVKPGPVNHVKPDIDDFKPNLADIKPHTTDPVTPPTRAPRRQTPRGPLLTEAEKSQIVALRDANWTASRIAERLGRTTSTISGFLYRRRHKMNAFLSTLPGSRNAQPSPVKRRRVAEEGGATVAGIPDHAVRRRRVPQFRFANEDECDIKPGFVKKEERA
ncbi:dimethyladenosine transferase [Pseudozyma hubeiensis SY62]|uniref:Dimethyladenosine transferase n=1 Tax=Pseudozyma hubeiensis (strain SY62) TaxID=1305764 RepID=R9P5F7_PSEHS|nr:dimethyladenosine transferase [Pseudozyma hubeiensis SY62]GAC96663.1 dimethyladenosine transferase [Pseudozyma hubeiensis SY62]